LKANRAMKVKSTSWSLLLVFSCLFFLTSCKPDLTDDAIPQVFFPDIILNLTLPTQNSLKIDGGTLSIDGGVRGIIIYRKNSSTYLAYERNCSFHPNDACATVEVHSTNLFMTDTCCKSTFGFDDGTPTGGPAWRSLRRYKTSLDGSDLTITSESANGM